MKSTRVVLAILGLALAACSGIPQEAVRLDEAGRCTAAFARFDAAVKAAGVGDAEAARVEGFPYLRVNRFLAHFRFERLEGAAREDWLDRLRQLDRVARQVEWANLSAPRRGEVEAAVGALLRAPFSDPEALDPCADLLRARDLDADGGAWLRRAARVPDSYSDLMRLAGFYPLTSLGVAAGFAAWKRKNLPSLTSAPGDWTRQGEVDLYRAEIAEPSGRMRPVRRLSADRVASMIAAASDNPLAIPDLTGTALQQVVETFAPDWQVDRVSAADLIGQPAWVADGEGARIDVDATRPVAFTRLSHVRFGGAILPQISYMVWFKERPRGGPFDLLGGALDAVIWRVTIGRDGRPWFYDTIHACGCYHLFFPVPPRQRLSTPEDKDLREEVLVPVLAPRVGDGEAIAVRLSAGSHYVSGLSAAAGTEAQGRTIGYRLLPPEPVPDLALRTAPLPAGLGGGSRSIYAPDGLVPGSERLERLILWPMGIASAGAMRQWGHHATAFVGRRHFDDPDLLDRAFRP